MSIVNDLPEGSMAEAAYIVSLIDSNMGPGWARKFAESLPKHEYLLFWEDGTFATSEAWDDSWVRAVDGGVLEIIRMLEGKFERYNLIKFVDDVPQFKWDRIE